MPSLHWIGKDKVINHHLEVPYRLLKKGYSFGEENSGNKIIRGDNLEALKALLPEYEGKIKCIYIDPPYNTGNEGWVYNDNVTDPKIKKWLGDVVGKEGEDLTRHDKWLCMMYPRLKLLHRLLSDDGAIFLSIDDNEQANLKLLMDEIFGGNNFIGSFIVNTTPNARDYGHIGKMHEFCLFYSKNWRTLSTNLIPDKEKTFKYEDKIGGYNIHPLYNSNVAFTPENRPNLYYPFYLYPDQKIGEDFFEIGLEKRDGSIEIFPPKSVKDNIQFVWRWGKEKSKNEVNKEIIGYAVDDGEYRIVQKMRTSSKVIRSLLLEKDFTSRRGTAELEEIFSKKTFSFPKPYNLIRQFIQAATDENSIVLDSFSGSGTTAHATLSLNKEDGFNRKFILVEMEEYAESITAERVKRVINGYGDKEGTGGGFDFYDLGPALLTDDGLLADEATEDDIRAYICYTETALPLPTSRLVDNKYWLTRTEDRDHYFYYERESMTVLDRAFLGTITEKMPYCTIWADQCHLSDSVMKKHGITFRKIPRDIRNI